MSVSERKKWKNALRKRARRKHGHGYCCEQCGTVLNLTLHHIVPVAHGGTSDRDNLMTLCRACHDEADKRVAL